VRRFNDMEAADS